MCMIGKVYFRNCSQLYIFGKKIHKHTSLLKMQVTKLRVKNVNTIRNKKVNLLMPLFESPTRLRY